VHVDGRVINPAKLALISLVDEVIGNDEREIASGCRAFLVMVCPPTSPKMQVEAMRMAFYAGAIHLHDTIMANLSPGPDAEPGDEALLGRLGKEMMDFAARMQRELGGG